MSPPPGKRPGTTVQETGQSSVPVWKSAENLATPVVRTPNRPVRRYTDCAIRAVRETQYEREKCTHTQYLYRTGHCKSGRNKCRYAATTPPPALRRAACAHSAIRNSDSNVRDNHEVPNDTDLLRCVDSRTVIVAFAY
jgi:hypothetical protein